MSILDYILASKLVKKAQVKEPVPEDVSDTDIENIKPNVNERSEPYRLHDITKPMPAKRPHTMVTEDQMPDGSVDVDGLPAEIQPVAQAIIDSWEAKVRIDAEIKQRQDALKEELKQLKTERGYDNIVKSLEENTQKLGQSIEAIDAQSDVVLRKLNAFFIAVVKQTNESENIMVNSKEQLDFVLNLLKDINSDLSRKIKMKLKWYVRKSTIIEKSIKKFVTMWPISKEKRQGQIGQDDELATMMNGLYEVSTNILNDLYELEGKVDSLDDFIGNAEPGDATSGGQAT